MKLGKSAFVQRLTLGALASLAAAVALATLAVLRPWSRPQLQTDLAH